jgi:hypothetical protein
VRIFLISNCFFVRFFKNATETGRVSYLIFLHSFIYLIFISMKKPIILLAFLLGIVSFASAQRVCGSDGHLQDQLLNDPGLQDRMESIERFTNDYLAAHPASDRTVVTIPVVVHVVWNSAVPAQNISDTQIASQLTVLNNDFRKLNSEWPNTPAEFLGLVADCEVNFCMAQRDPNGAATNGIVRKSSTTANWGTNDQVKYTANGGDNAWNSTQYLNIWVCQIGGGILGYAQFPGGAAATDGVVIDYKYFGTTGTATAPFALGRTATHEVGHWLNLRHIWGDANCGNDLVMDTPIHTTSNYGCPAQPANSTCGGTSHAMMTMNYMDYTDDACMYMFSTGQKNRAQALFVSGGSRVGLTTSLGCQAPSGGGTCGAPTGLASSAITSTSATVSWGAVSGATDYNLQWKLTSASTWTTVSAIATTTSNLTGLTANSSYDFQVQANCSGTASAYSTASSFTTSVAGGGCVDTNEPNNTRTTASAITVGTAKLSELSTSTDKDWWSFGNTTATRNIKVTLSTLPADYDLKVYRSSTLLSTSQNTGTTNEQVILNNATVSTAYTAYIYGYNGAYSNSVCYTLLVQLSSTAWRTDGSTDGDVQDFEIAATFENAGFGMFPNPATDQVTVEVPTEMEGAATVNLLDITGKRIASQNRSIEKGDNQFVFPLKGLQNGLYLVQVNQGTQTHTRKLNVQR